MYCNQQTSPFLPSNGKRSQWRKKKTIITLFGTVFTIFAYEETGSRTPVHSYFVVRTGRKRINSVLSKLTSCEMTVAAMLTMNLVL